jgi:hypothetical protein
MPKEHQNPEWKLDTPGPVDMDTQEQKSVTDDTFEPEPVPVDESVDPEDRLSPDAKARIAELQEELKLHARRSDDPRDDGKFSSNGFPVNYRQPKSTGNEAQRFDD